MAETMTYDPGSDTVTTENSLTPDEQQSLVDQAGQLASTPLMDPSKNPEGLANLAEATTPPE